MSGHKRRVQKRRLAVIGVEQDDTAAALSAFRACASNLVRFVDERRWTDTDWPCFYCGCRPSQSPCVEFCPVALARAAIERFPEVTT